MLCFSVIDTQSFLNLELKWIPEIKLYCPNAAVILIGTKIDMRCSYEINRKNIITYENGFNMKNKHGLDLYLEYSSKTPNNIDAIFDSAIKLAFTKTKHFPTIVQFYN